MAKTSVNDPPVGLEKRADGHYLITGREVTLDSKSVDLSALNIARIDLVDGAHLTVNPAGLDVKALGHITYGVGKNCTLTLSAPPAAVNIANSTTIDFGYSDGTGTFEYQPGNLGINVASPITIINLHGGDKIKVDGATSAELKDDTLLFKTGKTTEPAPAEKPGFLTGLLNPIATTIKGATNTVKDVLGTGAKFTINPAATFDFAQADNSGQITIKTPCFVMGTLISTPAGEIAVERLKIGNLVYTMNGEAVPIIWIGSRRIDPRTIDKLRDHAPIRIRPGALDRGAPNRNLHVSPDHCLFLNGSLVPAKLLINGTSITQNATLEPFIYYHIELEQHGVLIAEGAYAESYLDLGNRVRFLEPGTLMFTSPERAVNSSPCHPPVYCGPILDGIREELDQRAQALGYCFGKKPEPAENISNIFPFYKRIQ
ncbi:Hint domain-containing protein [Phyllobacterium calauticae]|jgi:Hint domain|uniref:Hint domain-containing protein n=1 Tax=Phyllobacterium calauticae TaxID=2817027 RepID=UPI001CBF7A42|nr:Hint domain-containing protein [Phyllobacterium calauticae]MBZ3694503.1 Hint domain-containing protein [Phyllobacterium calauticae]